MLQKYKYGVQTIPFVSLADQRIVWQFELRPLFPALIARSLHFGRRRQANGCRNLLTINHNPGFSLNTLSPQTWLAETWTTRGIPNCRHCHRLPVPGGCQVNARPESGGRGLWLSSWHLPRHLGPAAGEGNHSQEWWWEPDRYSPAAASSPSHQPHIKWFLIAPTTFNISTSCSAIQSLQNSRTESTSYFIL